MAEQIHTQTTSIEQLIDGLTRTESGKLISVLTRVFGTHNLSMAEDAVQDVLLKAYETWKHKGIPDNPGGWLYRAAKNRAIDTIRRNRKQLNFATDINILLESEYTATATLNDCFKDEEIFDDQLSMMFACCHPDISTEGQIALILKTLCGFSIAQIARAFITNTDTIEKRLYRAKQVFRTNNKSFEIPAGTDLQARLSNVLEAIYLLFNEAYSTSYQDSLIRQDVAIDCIHLCNLLTLYPSTKLPGANALLALLYFHTARMPGRMNANGDLLLMKEQDRKLWDKEMIKTGIYHLQCASTGNNINRYHLEAAIAYEHCKAPIYAGTDWKMIFYYYEILKQIVPTPVVLLNRAIVVKELEGPQAAIECIRVIPGINYLQNYYLLHAILGELNTETGNNSSAVKHFQRAIELVVSDAEKRYIKSRLDSLRK